MASTAPLQPFNITGNASASASSMNQTVHNSAAAVFENRLASARLGVATSLFHAMRAKHPAIAAHCLRVAIGCSGWASIRGMSETQQERLEIAALLHDLGMLGFPDRILRKSTSLNKEERMLVDLQGNLGAEILQGSFGDPQLLETMRHFRKWFEMRRETDLCGLDIPLEARMLGIVEAFDAMTNDRPYRTAMPFDDALEELQRGAGTQFDPELTEEYCTIINASPKGLHSTLVRRWLHEIRSDASERMWKPLKATPNSETVVVRLCKQLLERSLDPTFLVDNQLQIVGWNGAMQTATGFSSDQILGGSFIPSLIGLCSSTGDAWPDESCPIAAAIRSGSEKDYPIFHLINGTQHRACHLYILPLIDESGKCLGASAVFRSSGISDGLAPTPTAQALVPPKKLREAIDDAAGLAEQIPFSVLMITGFSGLPDGLAQLCRQRSRAQDLIGLWEEGCLLVLWPGCSESIAEDRMKQIESAWSQSGQREASSRRLMYALMRVQSGDNIDSILERGHANLTAKARSQDSTDSSRGLLDWLDGSPDSETPLEAVMATSVPPALVREKLRGFIADHNAEIIHVEEDQVQLRMAVRYTTKDRRRSERRAEFDVSISIGQHDDRQKSTRVTVGFQAVKVRDRRNLEIRDCAKQVATQLQRYLVAEFVTPL